MTAAHNWAALVTLIRENAALAANLTNVQQRSNELLEEARAARALYASMGELPAIWAQLDGLDRHILMGAARRLGRK